MQYKDNHKARSQRWAMINECIDDDIWNDEDHFRQWLYAEFGTQRTSKLSEGQTRILYMHLRFFTGKALKAPYGAAYPWRINNKQKWRMAELQKAIGYDDDELNRFIERQLGVKSFMNALSKQAANKVITGLEKVLQWKQKKAQ